MKNPPVSLRDPPSPEGEGSKRLGSTKRPPVSLRDLPSPEGEGSKRLGTQATDVDQQDAQDMADDPSPSGEGGSPERARRVGQPAYRANAKAITTSRALRKRMTPHEVKLWNWLREGLAPQGFHFRRQAAIGQYIVDFACLRARLVVELDGAQHGHPGAQLKDMIRDEYLMASGFTVLRFWNNDIEMQKDSVMDTIYAALAHCSAIHSQHERHAS